MGEGEQNSGVSFSAWVGARTVPWADSSGGTEEKGTVCGRAELLFYFCALHLVVVSELHERILFKAKETNLRVLEHLAGEQRGGHLLEPSVMFSL